MPNLQRCDVVLLNDDHTPMEFVVFVLERFFGMTRPEAQSQMLRIHHEGRAICGPKRPRKRLRMFSLLLASINTHYNVFLSERINSFRPSITRNRRRRSGAVGVDLAGTAVCAAIALASEKPASEFLTGLPTPTQKIHRHGCRGHLPREETFGRFRRRKTDHGAGALR
jgi:hypothetical protein